MNPKNKALQMIGSGVKKVGSSIDKALRKGVGKIMAPTVRVMKKRDEEMEEMDRKAKAGEFNY